MSKLTLTVDSEVVRQAKLYAASQKQSLSKLVENYLKSLSETSNEKAPVLKGVVAELAGIIDKDELANIDTYSDYLQEKYQ